MKGRTSIIIFIAIQGVFSTQYENHQSHCGQLTAEHFEERENYEHGNAIVEVQQPVQKEPCRDNELQKETYKKFHYIPAQRVLPDISAAKNSGDTFVYAPPPVIQKENRILNEKNEVFLSQPRQVIYQPPPTIMVLHHPKIILHPEPCGYHRAGDEIQRKITHKVFPRPVYISPEHTKIVHPREHSVLP